MKADKSVVTERKLKLQLTQRDIVALLPSQYRKLVDADISNALISARHGEDVVPFEEDGAVLEIIITTTSERAK